MSDSTAGDQAAVSLDELDKKFLSFEFAEDPYEYYRTLRSAEPAHFVAPMDAWIITSFDGVKSAFNDDRFQVQYEKKQTQRMGPGMTGNDFYRVGSSFLVNNDPPQHGRLRRVFRQPFSPQRVKAVRGAIEARAHECIDALIDAENKDIIAGYSSPVPLSLITVLMDIPRADEPMIKGWAHAFHLILAIHKMDGHELDEANRQSREAEEYFVKLVRGRRAKPGDDFVSDVIRSNAGDDDPMTDEQIASNLFLLFFAGFDTQNYTFANMVAALDRNPEAKQYLLEDTSRAGEILPELLRYDTAGQFMPRLAVEDIALGDVTIKAGQGVLLGMGAAAHYPLMFDYPDSLDVHRANAGEARNVVFGYGRHHCIGSVLAHSNLEIMLRVLFERLPGQRVDWAGAVRKPSLSLHAYDALPITW